MGRNRQMTMAKRAREQAVKERRALKQEKKDAARMAKGAEELSPAGEEGAVGEQPEGDPTAAEPTDA